MNKKYAIYKDHVDNYIYCIFKYNTINLPYNIQKKKKLNNSQTTHFIMNKLYYNVILEVTWYLTNWAQIFSSEKSITCKRWSCLNQFITRVLLSSRLSVHHHCLLDSTRYYIIYYIIIIYWIVCFQLLWQQPLLTSEFPFTQPVTVSFYAWFASTRV